MGRHAWATISFRRPNFGEPPQREVRGKPLLGTRVNRDKRKGRSVVPRPLSVSDVSPSRLTSPRALHRLPACGRPDVLRLSWLYVSYRLPVRIAGRGLDLGFTPGGAVLDWSEPIRPDKPVSQLL